MELTNGKGLQRRFSRRTEWRFLEKGFEVILYIFLLSLQSNCQTIPREASSHNNENTTKTDITNLDNNVESNYCHSCHASNNHTNNNKKEENAHINVLEDFIVNLSSYVNKNESEIENELETALDDVLKEDRLVIADGIEIKSVERNPIEKRNGKVSEGRALFSKYTYEYRMIQKVKEFFENHILSINLPKAARFITFRSFGLKKFFIPILIGAQVFKSILLAMFLPSILGSFGKILGKGISQLSAASSQASYPPANVDDQMGYNSDNKDFMGYETNQAGTYAYPQEGFFMNMGDDNTDLSNVDMSRFGAGAQNYLPTKNGYYKNQIEASNNNYKTFQKIPASSMILSNYDPFYSPLLSRLDGIFARLGLTPTEGSSNGMQIGGQTLSDAKLESCREQLICLMYASPAKYAPYSNLVSAQLSRELNELRRPVSDNPEILRFFRYMRAARRGQEGVDCMRAHPACLTTATPQHTMIAAYHDINKLVTARKIRK